MNAAFWCLVCLAGAAAETGDESTFWPVFEQRGPVVAEGEIDRLVFDRLAKSEIRPSNLCSDAVFLRRVYLDVIGTLPTPQESRDFLSDPSPTKRSELIDRLLEREEFADYWALKWGDLLRVKAEFPINLWPNGVQVYHRWIRTSIRDNMPYDRFARELLTSSGSNFRAPPVNFYRAMQNREPRAIAQTVALTFLGQRAEKWPEDRLEAMSAFFDRIGFKETGEWKEEIVYFDAFREPPADRAPEDRSPAAAFPDGTAARLTAQQDPRVVFADWLVNADNPWFARNLVNRIWYWLLGRGIIHEPDDIRADNPPSQPELLEYLERELIAARYDTKHIYRLILNSKTYQLSSIPRSDHPDAAACFAYYPVRRLDAEVLIDALCQITGTTEEYSSPIPEPFTFIPDNQRSIALADGSTSSSFLEMFGRPPRDTGLVSERNNQSTAAQRLHLLNSSHILQKIQQSDRLQQLSQTSRSPREAVTRVYLAILSRFPTDEELKVLNEYSQSGGVRGPEVLTDVAWALINTAEFLCKH
ncbi:MAG: DUF1553 domain-containing protein [Pirellulaceae bacterium]|nr:DUF1553 domain-containing protein [Pirellulaceae bacterium]